jgi:hypothetical protein
MVRTARLRALGAAAVACALLSTTPALAQAPAQPQAAAQERPARGMKMNEVESRFGAPASRSTAVGQPPITRWDYPGMIVYFEHDHVVHAVLRGT